MSGKSPKVKLFLDLGKPTLRGVRHCPKCGTLNGTRGISCKNKSCDVVFKERDKKKGHSAPVVKIVTGSSWQVFSVRQRDRGPDYRGFVQFPLVQDMDGNPAENISPSLVAKAARCFVETCTRNVNQQPCAHIKTTMQCTETAVPLALKNSVLNSLAVPPDVKHAIWMLAVETTGPLVQRVTKNTMVVKCQATVKTHLGFLHCSFFETARPKQKVEYKFQCTCKKASRLTVKGAMVKDEGPKRCVHYYACICAFASDEKLAQEFAYYIHLDGDPFSKSLPQQLLTVVTDPQQEPITDEQGNVISSINPECPDEVIHAELASQDQPEVVGEHGLEVMIIEEGVGLLLGSDVKRARLDGSEGVLESHPTQEVLSESSIVPVSTDTITHSGVEAQASSALLTLQEGQSTLHQPQTMVKEVITAVATPKKPVANLLKSVPPRSTPTPKKLGPSAPESDSLALSFNEWLGSVTERVNQTMHYQFNGNPEPLVFHSPQKFFDVLQNRISSGNRKRRLPNSTIGFIRKDALPLGTFTKYTWHITNILHVKQIFDTPEMPLKITRSFVENRDGTYDAYEPPINPVESVAEGSKNQTPIRPFELKTYLKVGNTARDQTEPTPFIIEWIPDILPHSRIGELRIKFEYGHERNGQIEHRVGQENL